MPGWMDGRGRFRAQCPSYGTAEANAWFNPARITHLRMQKPGDRRGAAASPLRYGGSDSLIDQEASFGAAPTGVPADRDWRADRLGVRYAANRS